VLIESVCENSQDNKSEGVASKSLGAADASVFISGAVLRQCIFLTDAVQRHGELY